MSGVAGDGKKDGILGERFRKVGFGAWRGRSVSGDAAHAEGGADGHERAVGFGHHHIGPLLLVLLERYVAFGCFDLIPIVCKDFNG